jgi:hypothetical protein
MKRSKFTDSQIIAILNQAGAAAPVLGQGLFDTLEDVQEFAICWLGLYNHERLNLGLGGITPKQKLALVA